MGVAELRPMAFPLLAPPRSRHRGPIVDAHMHAKDVAALEAYWDVAQLYGVTHAVVIADIDTCTALRKAFGRRIEPAVWGIHPRHVSFKDLAAFRRGVETTLERTAQEGFRIIKLWFTPRFHEMHNRRLDDPLFDFMFDRIRRLGLAVLVHVADPDVWFERRLSDSAEHGVKAEHYLPLAARLEQYPEVMFQAAHFGGHPEDLDHLAGLLDRYPNLVLDASATKWVAREFSRHERRARGFLVAYRDRVLFGTDLVADPEREKEGKREHYATRFYVHRCLWEERGKFASPIADEDADGPPRFQGLNLPTELLDSFYWGNAARLYQFQALADRSDGMATGG